MTRTLIVITDHERQHFLPAPLIDELLSLLPAHRIVDPLSLKADDWATLLAEFRPQLIITGRKTPMLPDDIAIGGDGLRYVCHLAGSVKHLVSDTHLRRGLLVSNWGNSVSRVMAECGLFLTIAALRRASHWALAMHREGSWKDGNTEFFSLFERRVGLHGFGAIARELLRLIQPFGVKLQTWSPSVPEAELAALGVQRAASLEALFDDNEVVIELASLTPRNRGIVDEAMLRRLRPGSVFVNIGRGAVVDEAAMVRVAREGKVQFALDVFTEEPLPLDSGLRGLSNVTLLPHLAGPTTDRQRDAGAFALENIRRHLAGDLPTALIDAEAFARST
ncbi:hydroxyacid dehydrogenase [Uliginosibacterium sp. H3]|uniref:Hydroxyacid dehydrogenase n=1 Tax=Uliginosibacterium silvisoli TaxID=3114758 RepID=A0ABU6JYI0_9RHOO|nr:hydroxyacid dehydrogenase [Uliginosibacterium sp. H3]